MCDARILLLAVFTASAAAQSPVGSWTSVNQLVPGTQVRVSLGTGKTVRGSVQAVTGDSLVIRTDKAQETLSRAQVRRIESRRASHRGRNALIGLGIGAGSGLAVGAAIDHGNHTNWFPNGGKAIVTPLGAIVGTVIGVAIPSGGWREVFRGP